MLVQPSGPQPGAVDGASQAIKQVEEPLSKKGMFRQVTELMYFVPDRLEAANWYAQLFQTKITFLSNPDYFYIQVGDQEVWFHQADSKVSSGAAGCVPYWQVENFDQALARAIHLGATLYRGPLDRQDGSYMCQVKDPFGNLIGLFGPSGGE